MSSKCKAEVVEVGKGLAVRSWCPPCKHGFPKRSAEGQWGSQEGRSMQTSPWELWRKAIMDRHRAFKDKACNRVIQMSMRTPDRICKTQQAKADVALFCRPYLIKNRTPMRLILVTAWRCTWPHCGGTSARPGITRRRSVPSAVWRSSSMQAKARLCQDQQAGVVHYLRWCQPFFIFIRVGAMNVDKSRCGGQNSRHFQFMDGAEIFVLGGRCGL